jgi:hypothetical protein
MNRIPIFVFLFFFAFSLSTLAENKPLPFSDWDSLSNWGTKRYKFTHVSSPGQKGGTGYLTLETKLTRDGVILKDRFIFEMKGKEVTMDMTQTCRRDKYLSPTLIECKGKGDDEFQTFKATIKEGKATIKGERNKIMEIPEGTVTMFAFFRIVTQIPRQAGATYAYDYGLEASEMNLKANYRVQVIGKETIIADGVPVKCWKIKQTGQGIHEQFYWVTDEGVLQRVLIDGRKQMDLQIGD